MDLQNCPNQGRPGSAATSSACCKTPMHALGCTHGREGNAMPTTASAARGKKRRRRSADHRRWAGWACRSRISFTQQHFSAACLPSRLPSPPHPRRWRASCGPAPPCSRAQATLAQQLAAVRRSSSRGAGRWAAPLGGGSWMVGSRLGGQLQVGVLHAWTDLDRQNSQRTLL